MVAQLLRLKLRLLGNSFRRSPWNVVALVFGVLYGLGIAGFASLGLLALRVADASSAGPIVTVLGSVVVLGFFLVPLVVGVEDTMDPRKFALFGVSTPQLSRGLAVAALISVPSVAITLVALAQVVTWTRGPLPTLLAIIGAALIVITCVGGARVSAAAASLALSGRRARESAATVGIVLVLLLSLVLLYLINVDWGREGADILAASAAILAWTPLGAAWAAPAVAVDSPGTAILVVLVAAAFAAAIWWLWTVLVARLLVTPQREGRVRTYRGLGWFDVFPTTPTGAIAARSLTYWARDSRYLMSLIVIPIVPFLIIIPLMFVDIDPLYLAIIPVPVAALFLGWSLHNDVAYDNTAIWVHVVSDTPGIADRLGRAIPTLSVGVPLLVLGSFISAQVAGDTSVLPSLLGISLGILLVGVGLSSVMSARFPYPVVHPGDSPFTNPQSSGTAASLVQSLSFLATLILASPALIFGALGLFGDDGWAWASLAAGVVVGLIVLTVGVRVGGRIFDARATDLLAFSMRN